MVKKVFIFTILFIIGSRSFISGQSLAVPTGTFVSPVDFSFRLSGGFSELRETHFHAGIDIKPSVKGKKDRIYSIGHGYVSRIRVSAGGYGYGLYIEHPETGFTSVYGHLESFSSRIDEIVKLNQNKTASFEVDITLTPDILPVSKGEVIGIMGNSGYSFGDHLHFEVRDTKTERPVNPFLFGFSAPDKISPSLVNLAIHGLDEHFHKLCDKRIPMPAAKNGIIQIVEPIEIPAEKIGLALHTYDRADGSHNKMGIYGLHVYADEKLIYSYHMDKISFDQSRQITGFYDYSEKKQSGQSYSLCYKLPGVEIDFLGKSGNGIIKISPDTITKIRMVAEDFHRNRKTLLFDIKRTENIIEKTQYNPYTRWVNVGQPEEIRDGGAIVIFGKNALYRSIPFIMEKKTNLKGNTIYQVHHEREALKSNIELLLKPDVLYPALRNKAIIVWISEKGKKHNCGGAWQDNFLRCRINEFGTFTMQYDTIAPTIKTILFRPKNGNTNKFRFEVKDDLPTKGRDAGDIQYTVKIDGNLIISPYNSKTSVLEVSVHHLNTGEHDLLITASDHSGNIREFKSRFLK